MASGSNPTGNVSWDELCLSSVDDANSTVYRNFEGYEWKGRTVARANTNSAHCWLAQSAANVSTPRPLLKAQQAHTN
jgi:hypothetical protein